MNRALYLAAMLLASVVSLTQSRTVFAAKARPSHCEGLAAWTGPFPPAAYFEKLRDIDKVSDFDSLAQLVAQGYGLALNPEMLSLAREFVEDDSLRDEFFSENLTRWMAGTDFVVYPSAAPDSGSPEAVLRLTKRARRLRSEQAMAIAYELAMWLRSSPNIQGGQLAVMREGLRHFTDPELKLRLAYSYHRILTAHFFRDLDFLDLDAVERNRILRAALKLDPPDNDAKYIWGGIKSVFNDEISNFDSLISRKSQRLQILKELLARFPHEMDGLSCLFDEFNAVDRSDLLKIFLANAHKIKGLRSKEYAKERLVVDFGLESQPIDWKSLPQGALAYIDFKNRVYDNQKVIKNAQFLAQFESLPLSEAERLGFLKDLLHAFPERLPALKTLLAKLSKGLRTDLATGYFEDYFPQMSKADQVRFLDYGKILSYFDLPPDLNLLEPGSRQETFFSFPPGTSLYVRDFANESDPEREVVFSIRNRPEYFLNGNFDGFFTAERFTPAQRRSYAEELLEHYLEHVSDLGNKFPSLASIVAYFNLSPAEAAGLEWVYED